jgi:hypothetical protein
MKITFVCSCIFSKSGLENELKRCRIAGIAAGGLVDIPEQSRSEYRPTWLDCCEIENSVLANK